MTYFINEASKHNQKYLIDVKDKIYYVLNKNKVK